MSSFLDFAWLIPFAPLLGTFFVWILLLSFNRTINRLTKPISYLLIVIIGLSTAISFLLYQQHISGEILNLNLSVLKLNSHLNLYVDDFASLASLVFGSIILIIMIYSYNFLDRKKGYVSYFSALAIASGLIFSFIFSGEVIHSFF